MTETEWRACTDPARMLAVLRGTATDRQLRHLMAAWAGWPVGWHHDDASGRVLAALGQFADGRLPRPGLDDRLRGLEQACPAFAAHGLPWPGWRDGRSLHDDVEAAALWLLRIFLPPGLDVPSLAAAPARLPGRIDGALLEDGRHLLDGAIRDVVGPHPFRAVSLAPGCRTAAVVGLADGIYREEAWDRLPALAAALRNAGCDDLEVLAHCRGDGSHVPGCWAVDLVLGKE